MEILNQLSLFSYLLASFSAIMIGFLFLTLKIRKQKGNVFLVLFLWALGFNIISDFLNDEELANVFNHISIEINSYLFIIPSLFIYIIIVTKEKGGFWWLFLYLPGIFLNLISFKDPELGEVLHELMFLFMNIPLLVIAFYFLKRYRLKLENYYSYVENKTLSWIKVIMLTIVGLHIFMFLSGILLINDDSELVEVQIEFIISLVTFFIVYWIGYNGFQQVAYINDVSDKIAKVEVEKEEVVEETVKNNKEINTLKFKELYTKIEKEKYYRNPNLTVKLLSELLTVKERELSNLINVCAKKNFHHFINQLRVLEFKRLIESDKAMQYSILGLAKDAGFSSKSTFYKVFKQIEGMTPSEYKSKLKCSEKLV
ncbi:AraC family transcriptional regulator [Tenacibaculum aiptasiae]|uniref:AraC family transcriptional regulator n=1 Tax=Tenacibaculum aiptasiae TaxID=426481 RepID=A0A7J5ACQ8_9FLAO|nr:helix-turn-helix domain-containing protein [Tenacibaculum aiptasiae]KAB1155341.1 AraC family transcriptional regulator [Tenacibaculum aiptasiae]